MTSRRLLGAIATILLLPAACEGPPDGVTGEDPPRASRELRVDVTPVLCPAPTVHLVETDTGSGVLNDSVVAGGAMSVLGCGLGHTRGQVYITLANGDRHILNPWDWSNGAIRGYHPVPWGVFDQDASLVVVRADGLRSAPHPLRFYARRYNRTLKYPWMNGACAGGSNKDKCALMNDVPKGQQSPLRDKMSFIGWHHNFCCSGSSGTDVYWADLATGWRVGYSGGHPLVDQTDGVAMAPLPLTDNGVCAALQSVGTFTMRNLSSGARLHVEVDWQIGGNCADVFYAGFVTVNGPVGTDP